MSKYDFGYELEEGTTNEWAYNQIAPNSVVLELGAAVGNLTKHLKENKNCIVDIVEIDTESGAKASRFARDALLGEIEGNLNTEVWYEKLVDKRFDYVVILDVLEHLDDPRKVLDLLKNLLSDTGKIVLSIPNIANNAVLINLYNDRFEYTELGLLDCTHKYFMTYHTIIDMVDELGYNIDFVDAIEKKVGTSEIANSYLDIPEEVGYFLRQRKLGSAYQYLLVLGKEICPTVNQLARLEKAENTFESLVLFNGLSAGMLRFENVEEKIDVEFDIPDGDAVSSIRFVPMEHSCVVTKLKATAKKENGQEVELHQNWSSGIVLENETIIFGKSAREINWELEGNERKIKIVGECYIIFQSMLPHVESCIASIQNKDQINSSLENKIETQREEFVNERNKTEQELRQLTNRNSGLEKELSKLNQVYYDTQQELRELNQENYCIKQELECVSEELQNIKTTKWYRVWDKMRQIGRNR